MTRRARLLLVGPLPPPIGGDTRHFKTLVEDLSRSKRIDATIVNVSRGRHARAFLANLITALRALMRSLSCIGRMDVVSVHASDRGMDTLGAAIVILCRICRRPCIVRIFGGSYGDTYLGAPRLRQWWARRWVLGADVVLLQTKRMIRQLEGQGTARLEWFSTYLPAGSSVRQVDHPRDRCRRFVFLGHLWRTKGIELVLEAARSLPEDATVDLWGPEDDFTGSEIARQSDGRATYRGMFSNQEALQVLEHYDCLLLPTRHPGEGYPGVIAEAFTAGIPVITTRWLAIPEIVDESCGILITPDSSSELGAAMRLLYGDWSRWRALRHGASSRAAQFMHDRWAEKFEGLVLELCGKPTTR